MVRFVSDTGARLNVWKQVAAEVDPQALAVRKGARRLRAG